MTLQTIFKQSYEERLFQFDFSEMMNASATLSTVVSVASVTQGYVVGSSAITISIITISGQVLQALFSGGTSGETYKITAKVTDSDGQKLEMDGLLRVQDE